MTNIQRFFALLLATLLVTLAPSTGSAQDEAADRVTVKLQSGRTFEGYVDQRTDEQQLWLHFGTGSVRVLRPVSWERVVEVRRDGNQLTAAQLRDRLDTLKKARLPLGRERQSLPILLPGQTYAELAQHGLGATAAVQSVSFDVALNNWDADAAADGLSIRVYPRDASGHVVPVTATLTVELYALHAHDFDAVPHGRGQVTERVARWTTRVSADAVATEQMLNFPFRNANPALNTDWSSIGRVHVRLVVPGHGVFEDSLDGVQIRPFAPLRDHQERNAR